MFYINFRELFKAIITSIVNKLSQRDNTEVFWWTINW
jgi:hypothetical protein